MKVKELIDELKKLPQEDNIFIGYANDGGHGGPCAGAPMIHDDKIYVEDHEFFYSFAEAHEYWDPTRHMNQGWMMEVETASKRMLTTLKLRDVLNTAYVGKKICSPGNTPYTIKSVDLKKGDRGLYLTVEIDSGDHLCVTLDCQLQVINET